MTQQQVAFEQEVRKAVTQAKREVLDEAGELVRQALVESMRAMFGVRYDRWDRRWQFDEYFAKKAESPILNEVRARAEELASSVVDEALREPIVFTRTDLAGLRKVLKDAILVEASSRLQRQAEGIVSDMLERVSQDEEDDE